MLADPLNSSQRRLFREDGRPVEWALSSGYVDYAAAEAAMEARVAAIAAGQAEELIWLLEHPPLYTAGVSAKDDDLLSPCLLYTSPSPRDRTGYRMPSSA